jgi:hypothetical protein
MARTTSLIASIALTLLATACGADDGSKDAAKPLDRPTSSRCINNDIKTTQVNTGSVDGDLLALSAEWFSCANAAVVVTDAEATSAAAELATALRAPIYLPNDGVDAELTRLDPAAIYMVTADPPEGASPSPSPDPTGDPEPVPDPSPGPDLDEPEDASADEPDSKVRTITASDAARRAKQLNDATGEAAPVAFIDPAGDPAEIISAGVQHDGNASVVWLVDAADAAKLAPIQAMAATAGAAVVPVDGADLLAYPEAGDAIRAYDGAPVRLIGNIPPDSGWEVNLLVSGNELPGGGYLLFAGEMPRRFIAYYGHPDASGMGALGHQDSPQATYKAMQPLLEQYDTGDAIVVPTFNPIATIAHNGGSTGRPDDLFESDSAYYVNYSTMHPPSRFAEYVEYAEEIDGYVTLDFQPGRNDFLYQVRQYEELLRHPNVGVALDPEWRLGPDEKHLEQIGGVSAAELNDVINYLADFVRDQGLPQKLVLLHQFRVGMITERDTLVDRDEIALVIQMDGEGQGGLSVKDDTWRAITAGTEDAHWWWGWKNFFERDNPGPNSPADTLSKDPEPVYISYQ